MTKSRIAIAAAITIFGVVAILSGPGDSGPLGVFGWTAVVCVALAAVLTVRERLSERAARRREPAVREVPASTGIQVLGAVLRSGEDDPYAFARKYSIVRRIHGDDNASRLTREEIEAEYDRYDRAETAASEDRCQSCDPERVPATRFVEAWDERPGRNRDIGEWVLCTAHAQEKVASVRSTGAVAVSEPLVGGDVR